MWYFTNNISNNQEVTTRFIYRKRYYWQYLLRTPLKWNQAYNSLSLSETNTERNTGCNESTPSNFIDKAARKTNISRKQERTQKTGHSTYRHKKRHEGSAAARCYSWAELPQLRKRGELFRAQSKEKGGEEEATAKPDNEPQVRTNGQTPPSPTAAAPQRSPRHRQHRPPRPDGGGASVACWDSRVLRAGRAGRARAFPFPRKELHFPACSCRCPEVSGEGGRRGARRWDGRGCFLATGEVRNRRGRRAWEPRFSPPHPAAGRLIYHETRHLPAPASARPPFPPLGKPPVPTRPPRGPPLSRQPAPARGPSLGRSRAGAAPPAPAGPGLRASRPGWGRTALWLRLIGCGAGHGLRPALCGAPASGLFPATHGAGLTVPRRPSGPVPSARSG